MGQTRSALNKIEPDFFTVAMNHIFGYWIFFWKFVALNRKLKGNKKTSPPLSSSFCLWIIWVLLWKSIKWITLWKEKKSFIYGAEENFARFLHLERENIDAKKKVNKTKRKLFRLFTVFFTGKRNVRVNFLINFPEEWVWQDECWMHLNSIALKIFEIFKMGHGGNDEEATRENSYELKSSVWHEVYGIKNTILFSCYKPGT